VDIGFLHDGDQGPFGPAAWIEQAGKVTAITDARHLEVKRADPGVPRAVAVAIALAGAFRGTFMALRANMLRDFELHEGLAQHAHPITKKINILGELRLAQQFLEPYP
jgi:hypothetical protein